GGIIVIEGIGPGYAVRLRNRPCHRRIYQTIRCDPAVDAAVGTLHLTAAHPFANVETSAAMGAHMGHGHSVAPVAGCLLSGCRVDRKSAGSSRSHQPITSLYVFGPKANSNEPSRDSAQCRKSAEKLYRPWHAELATPGNHSSDYAVLNEYLQPLRETGGQFTPLLHSR